MNNNHHTNDNENNNNEDNRPDNEDNKPNNEDNGPDNEDFLSKFPKTIIALSVVSLLMNISTSIISSTAANFVESILNCNISFIVMIRSFAEGFSYFLKALIGVFSDITKKRKLFLIIGYGSMLIIKPLFVLVTFNIFANNINSFMYAFAQILDRLLNAVRDTPRDSLIADEAPIDLRAQCFGLRRSFASMGSIIGGLLAFFITLFITKIPKVSLYLGPQLYRILYILAALPAIYSVFYLFKNVKEPKNTLEEEKESWFVPSKLLKENPKQLKEYGIFMIIIFFMSLGKFNEFCLFKVARNIGFSPSFIIFLYIYYYIIVSFSSYNLSTLKTKNYNSLFIFSTISLLITNLLMGFFNYITTLLMAILFSGIYVGITESIISGIIITIFPKKNLRATLLGIMNTVLGISACLVGVLISILSKKYSLQTIFLYGSIPPFFIFIIYKYFLNFKQNS
jgi:MFS family permease